MNRAPPTRPNCRYLFIGGDYHGQYLYVEEGMEYMELPPIETANAEYAEPQGDYILNDNGTISENENSDDLVYGAGNILYRRSTYSDEHGSRIYFFVASWLSDEEAYRAFMLCHHAGKLAKIDTTNWYDFGVKDLINAGLLKGIIT